MSAKERVDVLTPEQRHLCMSQIKGKDTKPEIIIRKSLHNSGCRYRLHRQDLPGKPDLVLPKYNTVILINGCFWHMHRCYLFKWPKTNKEFWKKKITKNNKNDEQNIVKLRELGWRILIIWECALKGKRSLPIEIITKNVITWLESSSNFEVIPNTR